MMFIQRGGGWSMSDLSRWQGIETSISWGIRIRWYATRSGGKAAQSWRTEQPASNMGWINGRWFVG